MPEFFNVLPPEEARNLLFNHLQRRTRSETVATEDGLHRVTHEALYAPSELPSFRRSTMDGYAVRAADTYGATQSLPAIVTAVDEVKMGRTADVAVQPGKAVLVHTGGMIPDSADAVVQIEHTQVVGAEMVNRFPHEIEINRPVSVGQNVLQTGEDVALGQEILPAGHHLRPQDIGGLLALGIIEVSVFGRPTVAILSTGDEVVSPYSTPAAGQIRDINSYTVAALTNMAGGVPKLIGIVSDDYLKMVESAKRGLDGSDMLVISAGSSVSVRDLTARVVDELGDPGVLLHGVATRPGKPTIVGVVGGKPVLGLPGNPVSAMVQFMMFGKPSIYRLQGLHSTVPQGIVWARVNQNVASESGREDYVPASLKQTEDGVVATPVFGKSNLIFTLIHANGLMKIPMNASGVASGDWVEVQLF